MILDNRNNRSFDSLQKVLLFLACCHTVILDEKKGQYNAASPDELALVNAGK
jgi:magnesium-transporting ATPase (P-type)